MNDELEYRNYLNRIQNSRYNRNNKTDYTHKQIIEQQIILTKVITESSHCKLMEFDVDFPAKFPCIELRQVNASVKVMEIHVCEEKVIIKGTVSISVDYKVYEGKTSLWHSHTKQPALVGTVKNISSDIPFTSLVEIFGVKSGDDVQVAFAGIEDCSVNSKLDKPFCIPRTDIVLYRKLESSFLLKICLKILRQVTVPVRTSEIFE